MAFETTTTMPVTPYGMPFANNGGMFGGANEWIVFLIIAMMFGWGGNGFGGGRNGFANGEILADQFALNDLKNGQRHIDDGVRGLERGICDTGFLVQNQGSQTRETIGSSTFALKDGLTNLGSKIDNCCCGTKMEIMQNRFDMSKGFCDVITSNNLNTRDILESNNANTQKILDMMTQNELQRLREQNNALTLQVSQSAQTATILGALKPSPIPAYPVLSPYESIVGGAYGLGIGNCGCNGGRC